MAPPARKPAFRIGVYLPLIAVAAALLLFGIAFTNKSALLRRVAASRALSEPAPGAADAAPALPNCGIPALKAESAAACKAEQTKHLDANPKTYWGVGGFERLMGTVFNRFDGRLYFPWARPVTIVHVGAHGGSMLDRYGHLMRGPRLDDRIVMADANPLAFERLSRRIRMDPRLSLLHAAVYDSDGEVWFEYASTPNANTGGKVSRVIPTNATKEAGAVVRSITLDSLLAKVAGPIDFLMMDADGHEPWVLEGAKATLARTRLIFFNCNEHWKDSGTGRDLMDYIRDVFTPAGFAVSLIGEKRNVMLNPLTAPDGIATALPTWGFCLAAHVAPPAVRDFTEFAKLIAGSDAVGGPCENVAGALVPSVACTNGVLNTLGAGAEGELAPPLTPPPTVFY